MLPDFFFCSLFPVQQTTSGIVPRPVCRNGDACGMKVPAVKQKRIATEDVLLPSLPPDVGTRWSVSPTYAVPV